MAVSSNYRAFILEQLQRVEPTSARSMFGGAGLYARDLCFALIDDDCLYFKVDDSNRADFEERGMGPFRPFKDERAMQYYELPADVLENVDELREWMHKAIRVAAASKSRKRKGSR